MKQIDYEDTILDYEPCAQLGTILQYMCLKHDITKTDFLVLLELHKVDKFTWEDFSTAQLTANWDKRRFYRYKESDYIDIYRKKGGKFKRYNIYKITAKTKRIVREFYNLLSGRTPLPAVAYDSRARYRDNRLAYKINKLNGST